MSIVLIFPIALFTAMIFKKNMEHTLAFSAGIVMLVLFFGGMVTSFTMCIKALFLFAVLCAIVTLFKGVKEFKEIRKKIFTPGMLFLLFFMIYSMLSTEGRFYSNQDEYAAWAVGSKFMYLFDHYWVEGFPRYSCYNHMPGTRLWGLLSTKLWFRYADGIQIFGQSMFCICFMLPLMDRFAERKEKFCAIVTMVLITLLPRLGTGGAYSYMNVMPDVILAIENIYVILMFRRYLESKDAFFVSAVFVGLAMSALTKESGFFIALIEIFVMVWVLCKEQTKDAYWNSIRIIKFGVFQVIAPVIIAGAWRGFLSSQGSGGIRRMETIAALFGKIHPILIIVAVLILAAVLFLLVRNFIRTGNSSWIVVPLLAGYVVLCVACVLIGNQPQDIFLSQVNSFIKLLLANSLVGHWMPMSLLMFMTAVIAIDVALRYVRGNRELAWPWLMNIFIMTGLSYTISLLITDEFRWINNTIILLECVIWIALAVRLYAAAEEKSRLGNTTEASLLRYLLCGHLMYLAFLFVSYSIGFSDYEASIAASADRYEQTFLLLLLGVFVDIWLDADGVGVFADPNAVSIILSFIVMNTGVFGGIAQLWDKPEEDTFYGLEHVEFSFDDTICYVDVREHYSQDWLYRFLYASYPVQVVTGPSWTWYVDDELYTNRVSIDSIQDYLQDTQCDYVYIQNTDDGFKEFYADLFENAEDIENNRLYRIVGEGDELQLEFVP